MAERVSSYVLKPTEAVSILLKSLQRFYTEKKFFDVSITFNGHTLFGCHKLVLASSSSYFETLLSGTDGFAILNLDAVDSEYVKHLKTIVNFMYGRNVEMLRTDPAFDQLYEAARIFGVTALIKMFDNRIQKSTSMASNNLESRLVIALDEEPEVVILKPYAIGSVLLVNFQRFKSDGKFIDAKICCRDQVLFHCHKLVLASFSSYFEVLLSTTEGSAILNLDAVDFLYIEQLSTIIRYMYGDTACVKAENVLLLRDAAHVFGVQTLESGGLARLSPKASSSRKGSKGQKVRMKNLESGESAWKERIQAAGQSPNIVRVSSTVTVHSANSNDQRQTQGQEKGLANAPMQSPPIGVAEEIICHGHWDDATEQSAKASDSKSTSQAESASDPDSSSSSSFTLCRGCGKTFQQGDANFRLHALKHELRSSASKSQGPSARPQKCAECSFTFRNVSSLRSHWELTHGSTQKNRGCFTCGLVLSSKAALQRHYDVVHMVPGIMKTTTSKSPEPAVVKKLICKVCGYTSTVTSIFIKHVNEKHLAGDTNCHICSASFGDRQSLNVHYQKDHDVPLHVCHICGRGFKSMPGYRYHMDTHGEAHQCSACSFSTATKRNLDLHTKKYHPKSPAPDEATDSRSIGGLGSYLNHLPFKCTECPTAYLYKSLLTRHIHKKHLKLKPFGCPYCGHSTTEKGALQQHIRCVHTKEARYECEVCGFKCKTSSILSRHRRQHTGEKPYVCGECGVGYPEKRDLTSHHWKVHLQRRPYLCSLCRVGFFRKDNLLQHQRLKHPA